MVKPVEEKPVRWREPEVIDRPRSRLEKTVMDIVRTIFGDKRIDITQSSIQYSLPCFKPLVRDKDTIHLISTTIKTANLILKNAVWGNYIVNRDEVMTILNHITCSYRANNVIEKIIMKLLGYDTIVHSLSTVISLMDKRAGKESVEGVLKTVDKQENEVIRIGEDRNIADVLREHAQQEYFVKQVENLAIVEKGFSIEQIEELRDLRAKGDRHSELHARGVDYGAIIDGMEESGDTDLVDEAIRRSGFSPITSSFEQFIKKVKGEAYREPLMTLFYRHRLKKFTPDQRIQELIGDLQKIERFVPADYSNQQIFDFMTYLSEKNCKRDNLFVMHATKILIQRSDMEGLFRLLTAYYEGLENVINTIGESAKLEKEKIHEIKKLIHMLANTLPKAHADRFAAYFKSRVKNSEGFSKMAYQVFFTDPNNKKLMKLLKRDPNFQVNEKDFNKIHKQFLLIRKKNIPGLLKKWTDLLTSKDAEKLTFNEFVAISLAGNLHQQLLETRLLEDLMIESDDKEREFLKDIELAKHFTTGFSYTVMKQANKHYRDGDILIVSQKRRAQRDETSVTKQILNILRSDYRFSHVYKLYHDSEKQIKAFHIGYPEFNDFSFKNVMISEAWRINLPSLASPKLVDYLNQTYGKNWQQVLNEKYQKIESSLHNYPKNKLFCGQSTFGRAINAGLARYKLRSHKRKSEKDFSRIYKQFFEETGTLYEQLCSEFVSKTTLAAIMEVNKELTKELSEKFPQFTPDEIRNNLPQPLDKDVNDYLNGKRTIEAENKVRRFLEGLKYPTAEIDLIIRLGNGEVLDLPFDRREKMKRIYPGRMIDILENKGCIEKIPRPPAFEKMIKS